MSTKAVLIIFATSLLHWCQVPTMPALAAKAPVGGRGSRMKVRYLTRLYDLEECNDKTHYLVIRNFSNHLEKDGMEYLDTNYDLTSTARRLTALKLIIHRCPLGVEGNCEYFNTWSWNMPVCQLMSGNGMPWTPVFQNLHPKWECPILKGSYMGRNMTIDVAAVGNKVIEGLNVDRYSWPVEAQFDSENGLYICFVAVGQARRVRVKEN